MESMKRRRSKPVSPRLSQGAFDDAIARLERRLYNLRAARSGEREAHLVEVTGHWVSRHWVGDHVRLVTRRADDRRRRRR